jgi:hypothetical protein
MRCQSLVDRTPLLAQEETFVDLTAPVRALPAYLHNHSQGCRSRSASTPSASNLLARGSLLAYARACRNEPSRPLAEHFARFRGRASPNPFGPSPLLRHLSSDSPRHKRFSASVRIKGAHHAWLLRAHCIRSLPPHIIALHVVALHGYSSSSCCRARTRLGLAASQVPLRPSSPRYCLARPRRPPCGSVPSHHASPPPAHAQTARVLGPHRAATHASKPALHVTARSGPFTSARVLLLHSHAHAACICAVLAPALPCRSRASTLQRPLCSATHVLLDPCARITSLRSCSRHSRIDALLPLRCASTLVRPTPANQRRLLA